MLDEWGVRLEEATRNVLGAKARLNVEVKVEELGTVLLQEAVIATTENAVEEILENVADWAIRQHLEQVAGANYRKIYQTTVQNIGSTIGMSAGTTIGLAIDPTDELGASLVSEGGRRMGLVDLDQGTKKRLFRELEESRLVGEGPVTTARRIRDKVPAGNHWKTPKVRARVIARTETLHAQRASQLATYASSGVVKEVMVFDDRIGFGDAVCSGLNGSVVSISSARTLMLSEHPNGTRSFAPHINCRGGGRTCSPLGSTKRPGPQHLLDGPYKQGLALTAFGRYNTTYRAQLRSVHLARLGYVNKERLKKYLGPAGLLLRSTLLSGKVLTKARKQIVGGLRKLARPLEQPSLLFKAIEAPMDFQKGTRVKLDSYTHTSGDFKQVVKYDTAEEVPTTVMEIHAPKGTRSIVTNADEVETILTPGQELDIIDLVKDVDIGDGKKIDTYVVARAVPKEAAKPKLLAKPRPEFPDTPELPPLYRILQPSLLFKAIEAPMDFQKGTRVKLDSYTHTSGDFKQVVKYDTAEEVPTTVMEIHAPKGTRSIVTNADEVETILTPGRSWIL